MIVAWEEGFAAFCWVSAKSVWRDGGLFLADPMHMGWRGRALLSALNGTQRWECASPTLLLVNRTLPSGFATQPLMRPLRVAVYAGRESQACQVVHIM